LRGDWWGTGLARSRGSALRSPASAAKRGQTQELWFDSARIHLFDPDSGEAILAG